MDSIDRAIGGAASSGLSREQKRDVAKMARRAWDRQGMPEFADQSETVPAELRLKKTEAFTLWRQNEQRQACGRLHLTTATQRDFNLLLAHFASLAGETRVAEVRTRRAAGDDDRRALAVLRRELDAAADAIERPRDYAASIARSRFKTTDFEALAPRQIWGLVYDIRRAASRRRGGGSAEAGKTQGTQYHNGRALPF